MKNETNANGNGTMTRHLTEHKEHASGRSKNICTSAVLAALHIPPSAYHYAEHSGDVKRIMRRNGYSVRSRKSSLPKSVTTISRLRRWLADGNGERGCSYYVGVPGHALLLWNDGRVMVDTDPRKSDRRRIRHISRVEAKR